MMKALASSTAIAVVLLGCSGSGTYSTTTSSTGGTTGTGTSSGGTTGGMNFTVIMSNFAFSPGTLVVPAGATVTFTNNDSTTHTAVSESAAGNFTNAAAPGGWSFDVTIQAGQSQSIVVPSSVASGTVQPYFCTLHTTMMSPANPVLQIQ